MFEEKMPSYLNPNLYNFLREQKPDWKDFDLLEMSDVGTYVYTATVQGLELEFPVSEELLKWSAASAAQFTYEWLGASPQLWQLSMQKMLTLLIEAGDYYFGDSLISETDVLKTNLNATGSSFSDEDMPYFMLLWITRRLSGPLPLPLTSRGQFNSALPAHTSSSSTLSKMTKRTMTKITLSRSS